MNLRGLSALYNWMKERGVLHAKVGTLELAVPFWPEQEETMNPQAQGEPLKIPNAVAMGKSDYLSVYDDPMLYNSDKEEDVPRLPDLRVPDGP